jgi:DNA-binding GntR family transcriptional regulator
MSGRADSIRQTLLERIFCGSYPPGTALREARLARELGVSQATVREALQGLEHAGLVIREPNLGTTVIRFTPKDIRERVGLRSALEVRAALLAAERMGPAEFEELERRLGIMGSFVAGDKYYEAAQADLDFHRFVWQCSGNNTLCEVLEWLVVPLLAFISILRAQGLEHLPEVTFSHEPMIEALHSGDPAQIEVAFREGAESSYRDFIDVGSNRGQKALAFGLMGRLELTRATTEVGDRAE